MKYNLLAFYPAHYTITGRRHQIWFSGHKVYRSRVKLLLFNFIGITHEKSPYRFGSVKQTVINKSKSVCEISPDKTYRYKTLRLSTMVFLTGCKFYQ